MGVLTLCKFTKKQWKMKKAFCFDYFSMSQSKSKFFHVWFEFFPSYLSRKKEISETFLGLGLRPRPQKTFPRFPFFYFGNLGKTQIRRGKILLQTWHGKKSKQNTISRRWNEFGPLNKKDPCQWSHCEKAKPISKILLVLCIDTMHIAEV